MDGETRTVRVARGWITVLGFFETRGRECCMLSPQLTEAAGRYWDRPVRVIQVALPTGGCRHGAGCVETCHVRSLHLMALCDAERSAHAAFGSPAPGTVVAVGGDGRIAAVTTIDEVEVLYPQLDRLAEEAERKSLPGYGRFVTQ
jgi:hypothetical protein